AGLAPLGDKGDQWRDPQKLLDEPVRDGEGLRGVRFQPAPNESVNRLMVVLAELPQGFAAYLLGCVTGQDHLTPARWGKNRARVRTKLGASPGGGWLIRFLVTVIRTVHRT